MNLNIEEKLAIAKQLEMLGVECIAAGFPVSGNGDFDEIRTIAQNIKKPIIAALARASETDIGRAWNAVKYANKPRIHTLSPLLKFI